MTNPMDGWITAEAAASRLGVKSRRIRQLADSGRLPSRKAGRKVFVEAARVETMRNLRVHGLDLPPPGVMLPRRLHGAVLESHRKAVAKVQSEEQSEERVRGESVGRDSGGGGRDRPEGAPAAAEPGEPPAAS